MNGDPPAEPLHDFGVLFVHGIGQTREAETLLNFGEPLRRCIEKIAEPCKGAQNQVRVTVSTARLDPETGKGPAYAQLRINGAAETEQSWLLAEGWWAKKFPTAPVSEIVRWGFRVFPWTLLAHFDRRFRRLGFRSVNAINGVHPLRLGLPYVGRCLLEGAMTVVALALLPLLLLTLSALTLLGIIPYEPIRKLAQSLQRVLASTIGDSYVLKDQPMVAAAITESVRGNLEWLAQRCKRVAVVAHSQGGAIAHRVLRGPITSRCDLLVTFGSGLGKLSDIERVDEFQGRRLLNWAIAGTTIAAAPLLVSSFLAWWHHSLLSLLSSLAQAFLTVELGIAFVVFDLIRANLRDDSETPANALPSSALAAIYLVMVGVIYGCFEWSLRAWPIIVGNVLIGTGLTLTYGSIRRWHVLSGRSLNTRTQWLQDRKLFRDYFQLDNRHWMRWVDIYASADPVPNGPLLDDFEPKDVLTTEITNVGSALKDHTAYWKNTDEFLPRVAIELIEKAGLRKRFYNSLGVSSRRRWRVGWLSGSTSRFGPHRDWARLLLGRQSAAGPRPSPGHALRRSSYVAVSRSPKAISPGFSRYALDTRERCGTFGVALVGRQRSESWLGGKRVFFARQALSVLRLALGLVRCFGGLRGVRLAWSRCRSLGFALRLSEFRMESLPQLAHSSFREWP